MLAVAGCSRVLLRRCSSRAPSTSRSSAGRRFARLAALQHQQRVELVPQRGPIVDRNGEALALSVDVPSVYVRPREFAGQEARARRRSPRRLDLPVRTLRERLDGAAAVRLAEAAGAAARGARPSTRLGAARRLHGRPRAVASTRTARSRRTSSASSASTRRASRASSAASTASSAASRSFVDVDRDARGREMLTGGVQAPPPQGSRVELTIDAGHPGRRPSASSPPASRPPAPPAGAAVVLDPATGEVLALANVPTFNPNQPGDGDATRRWRDRVRNRAITDPYEPGSTFKAVLAAAAIEERVVDADRDVLLRERPLSRSASGRSTTPIRTAGSRSPR